MSAAGGRCRAGGAAPSAFPRTSRHPQTISPPNRRFNTDPKAVRTSDGDCPVANCNKVGRSVPCNFVLDQQAAIGEDLPILLAGGGRKRMPDIVFPINARPTRHRPGVLRRNAGYPINEAFPRPPGLAITAQIAARLLGRLVVRTWEVSRNPFQTHPSLKEAGKKKRERSQSFPLVGSAPLARLHP